MSTRKTAFDPTISNDTRALIRTAALPSGEYKKPSLPSTIFLPRPKGP